MKTDWMLHGCIVLAVGVGLVSCTKEQIDQAMNRPAEIILQSSPCTPAGIASTATPEFCVNVTELQLLRQDTQADVSLTLVNRTGRRQYINLTGADLTDSSGTKWGWTRSSGLGDNSNPLPLEPNVETQGSIVFSRAGQAPAGLTFSLRGEFAILRIDSRGQPINQYPYAVKRGFNLSGIRIQQPPPQSSAPTEQKPDSKLAQVAPRGVDPAASKALASSQSSAPGAVVGASGSGKPNSQKPASPNDSSSSNQKASPIATPAGDAPTSNSGTKSGGSGGAGPDVIGLRIGMMPDQAREIFKSHGFGSSTKSANRPIDQYDEFSKALAFSLPGQAPQSIPNSKYLIWIHGSIRDIHKGPEVRDVFGESVEHEVSALFGPVPGQEGIISISRRVGVPGSNKPTVDAFEKTLFEKYGTPTEKPSPQIYLWVYDSNGTLRKPNSSTPTRSVFTCPRDFINTPDNIGLLLTRLQSIQEFKQSMGNKSSYPDGCGAIQIAMILNYDGGIYAGPGTLVNAYSTQMTGFDATIRTLDAAKAIIDTAQKDASGAAIKKGQQQKPQL